VKEDSKGEEKVLVLLVQLGSEFIYDMMISDEKRCIVACK
jgi:hypothetical protein